MMLQRTRISLGRIGVGSGMSVQRGRVLRLRSALSVIGIDVALVRVVV